MRFTIIYYFTIWIPMHLAIAVPTKSASTKSMDKSYSFDKSELDTIFGPTTNDGIKPMQQLPLSLQNLPKLTGTSKSCYIKLPQSNLTDMNFLMGLWNIVRKVESSDNIDYRYICEKAVYTPTGPNTFNKVSNIHFHKKWITLTANGTFVSPGTCIMDNHISDEPNRNNRVVLTVLGTDLSNWLVGFNCQSNCDKPQMILQTRSDLVPLDSLEQAYSLMDDDNLPINDMVCQDGF